MSQTGTDNDAETCCQVAALPWRTDADGKIRILLVTSRTNGKWMLPKGWPIKGKSESEAALTEAQEEAGIDGTVSPMPTTTSSTSTTAPPSPPKPQSTLCALNPSG